MRDSTTESDFLRGGDGDDPPSEDTIIQVASYLDTLKESGGTILVTGQVSERIAQAHIKTSMGTADRKQLLALADAPDLALADYLPNGVTPDDPGVEIIERTHLPRSAAADSTSASSQPAQSEIELVNFREEIVTAATSLQATNPEAGDLRVVVNCLDSLLDDATLDTVRRMFVSVLATYIANADGILYLHLRHPDESEIVSEFADLVDARVELRYPSVADHEQPQERWHIPAENITTQWFRPQKD